MTLSLNKLEQLLNNKGLLIKKIFEIGGICVYFELLSISNAELCMLYIPSKYEISVSRPENVYKLNYIDIDEDGNIPHDYAGELDNFELEKKYNGIELDLNPADKSHNMEERLEESYNYPVSLKDMSREDKKKLRETLRQLRRLKLCVQAIKYKLCIMFKNYICCIRRDNTYECYSIKNFSQNTSYTLFTTFDLETFYSKIDSVIVDIKTVREGIYKVLDKNQHKHTNTLEKILNYKKSLLSSSIEILNRKQRYISYMHELEQLLETSGESERYHVEKIIEIEKKYDENPNLKGLTSDIEKSHLIASHEKRLAEINEVKQEIIANILKLKIQHETISLKIDKICFDNTVMLDAILKNFELLVEI